MFPYIVVFIISIFATYKVRYYSSKKLIFYIYSVIAITPLVLLAALRDHNIGTDTPNYVYLFQSAVENNGSLLYYFIQHPSFEKGFLLYNYIIARCTDNIVLYFLITYGIIFGLIYSSALKLKSVASPHIFLYIYLFLFFSDSLNVMRQYLAISLVVFAVSNLLTGKSKTYILFTIFATLIHTSAIISFLIGTLFFLAQKYPIKKHKLKYVIICVLLFLAVLNIGYFTSRGLLPVFEDKFNNYMTSTDGGLSSSHRLIGFFTLYVVFRNYKSCQINDTLLLCLITVMMFYISPNINATLYRLTIYFNIMYCIAVASKFNKTIRGNDKLLVKVALALYLLFYVFSIVINKTNEVIPYTSTILGI